MGLGLEKGGLRAGEVLVGWGESGSNEEVLISSHREATPMNYDPPCMTAQRAWELCEWCCEAVKTIRDYCQNSERDARNWWENDCDKPEELAISPRRSEDMLSFADRLQAEGYKWVEEAGSLLAEERSIKATVRVEPFTPADELDGPVEGQDLTRPSPAVALRFYFDQDLIDFLKSLFRRVHTARGGGPWPGGWAPTSKCWYVRSTHWEEVRQALLEEEIELTGPLAHPRTVKEGFGFFEREQVWDVKRCVWR
jgi:hypothetical protein